MKMRIRLKSITAMAVLVLTAVSCNVIPQFGSAPVEKVVKAMSLEDKAAMVVVLKSDGCTHAVPEMGIPSVSFAEVTFPEFDMEQILAQTWNTRLALLTGRTVAGEVLQKGADCLHPFWPGTSPREYSKNKILSARMASALMEGVQAAGTGAILNTGCEGSCLAAGLSAPWAVITEFDSVYDFAREIRDEWNYQGLTIVHAGENVPAPDMILAGYDLIFSAMPSSIAAIVSAVEDADLDEDILDACVVRVLDFISRSIAARDGLSDNAPADRSAISADIARESVVLLRNNGALPFEKSVKHIALYGSASYKTNLDGTLLASGYRLDPAVTSYYSRTAAGERKPFQLRADAIENEMALIMVSRDHSGTGQLTDAEMQLIDDVCEAFHSKNRKVTVILNTPVPMETASWSACPDAILQIAGMSPELNQALADVMSGRFCPSGRLVDTWPSYGFAYGMSYTSFTYSDEVCVCSSDRTTMSVKVTNSGSMAGMQPVLFYDGQTVPENLLGFAKSRLLQPGESQIVELTIADSIPQAIIGPAFY